MQEPLPRLLRKKGLQHPSSSREGFQNLQLGCVRGGGGRSRGGAHQEHCQAGHAGQGQQLTLQLKEDIGVQHLLQRLSLGIKWVLQPWQRTCLQTSIFRNKTSTFGHNQYFETQNQYLQTQYQYFETQNQYFRHEICTTFSLHIMSHPAFPR